MLRTWSEEGYYYFVVGFSWLLLALEPAVIHVGKDNQAYSKPPRADSLLREVLFRSYDASYELELCDYSKIDQQS